MTGSSSILGAALSGGQVTVEAGQTLTLDGTTVTGSTFTDIASGAMLVVDAGKTLTFSHVIVNGGGINVGAGGILNLVDTQIVGATLSDFGTINVSGTSTVDGFANVVGGQVTVAAGQTLVIDEFGCVWFCYE